MVKTKIICTLGPSSSTSAVIRNMTLAGMDVARLNFSHGNHEAHKNYIDIVRSINKKYHRAVKILGDLEGNRIRIGKLKNHKPLVLTRRKIFYLTNRSLAGSNNIAGFDYQGELSDIKKNQLIFIDDGNICLKVKAVSSDMLKTEVVSGGLLKENKGINIPAARLKFHRITEKDKIDLAFCIRHKVDYIAQSFVRDKKDILKIRQILANRLPGVKIIAKIENKDGIRNIDGIIDVSDGIMIARGDMGISIPIYQIPVVQKEIIAKCNKNGKFVITATQMLESMVEEKIPHRSEVTDVANAILDGSDFVMLSAETAAGKYPVESARMMNQIIKFTEGSRIYKNRPE
ncbi:MAG: pyruvate kinase [Candidatus Omnitrophica bacterium]|nr:pyruvate kinase [Candidatus Omnitrophota bacterium]HOX53850.1 pyruvate kinase [Candidatus Omnitrophota bacterium]